MEELKKKLEEEKELLLREINKIAIKDKSEPGGYAPKETTTNIDDVNDEIDQADEQENIATNNAILVELESRLEEVDTALAKIGTDAFGICIVCAQPIEEDRLKVNPAAKTCKKHMEI